MLAAVPLAMVYLQAWTDLRTYDADPACAAGIAAPPNAAGGCGVGIVAVGSARRTETGSILSLKFGDGARREVRASATAYRLFRAPGTLAFVQVRRGRITLLGDQRYVETTVDHPERRVDGARDSAVASALAALGATAVAIVLAYVRRDGAARRPNERA